MSLCLSLRIPMSAKFAASVCCLESNSSKINPRASLFPRKRTSPKKFARPHFKKMSSPTHRKVAWMASAAITFFSRPHSFSLRAKRNSSPPHSNSHCSRFSHLAEIDYSPRTKQLHSYLFLGERMIRNHSRILLFLFAIFAAPYFVQAQEKTQTKPRARDLGIPFDGTPGPGNAITDVPGVLVGHTTLISGEGKLQVGKGPVRTGVTAVLPRGKNSMNDPVYAGWFSQNGNGEMTGTTWVEESGFLEGPIGITNTHSVGLVRDSIIAWSVKSGRLAQQPWSLPVVAETWDGYLNDINGFHVQQADVFSALDTAKAGSVPEGNVGGGTGM